MKIDYISLTKYCLNFHKKLLLNYFLKKKIKIKQKQKQIRKQTKSFSKEQTGRNVKDQMIRP